MSNSFYDFMVMQSCLALERKRKNGETYTIEEIEQYTKENPNKVFQGDLVPAKNEGYLVYLGDNKWINLDDLNNLCFNISKETV
jgi:hypothetical protein